MKKKVAKTMRIDLMILILKFLFKFLNYFQKVKSIEILDLFLGTTPFAKIISHIGIDLKVSCKSIEFLKVIIPLAEKNALMPIVFPKIL